MSKPLDRVKARELRHQGLSLQEISNSLGVSKSSVSNWTRGIDLSEENKQRLIQKSLVSGYGNHYARDFFGAKRRKYTEEAEVWLRSSMHPDFLVFAALYWGEGSKGRGGLTLQTSDPYMVTAFLSFLRKHCAIEEGKLRGGLNIHPQNDLETATIYWEEVSGIPRAQWHKAQVVVPRSSKGVTENRCPYGTFAARYHDTALRAKVEGWMKAIGYGGKTPQLGD